MDKVFVVGLDGATWKVLNPLIKKGKMPFFKTLKEGGALGVLESTNPPLTAPAWTSFQTGVNPGKHGIYGFLNYRKDVLNPPVINSNDIKSEKIWNFLAKFNLKSLVINMPVAYPVSKISGILVSSFLTPLGKQFAYPKSIEKELKKIGYRIDMLVGGEHKNLPQGSLSKVQRKKLLQEIVEIAKLRVEAYKKLSPRDNYSFSFLLFKETDIAQHMFWGERELEDFYSQMDKMLKELHDFYLQNSAGQGNFLIISDHGFHKIGVNEFSFYKWLQDRGDEVSIKSWRLISELNKSIKKFGFSPTRIALVKKTREIAVSKAEKKALAVLLKKEGLLASPEGVYFFNNKWNQHKQELIQQLRNLKHDKKKVFQAVLPADKVYKGGCVADGPDVVWVFNEKFSLNASPLATTIFNKRETHIKGDHISDREGIFLIKGRGIKKGRKGKLSIEDIFPLTCYLLGVDIPEHIDGKLPKDIFSSKHQPKSLGRKVREAKRVIRRAINNWGNDLGIAFTGRKDSLVMMHILRAVSKKTFPVMFIDHGLHFEESRQFLKKITKMWNLDVRRVADKKLLKKLGEEKRIEKKKTILRDLKIKTIASTIKKHKWKALVTAIRRDESPARADERYFSKRKDHTRVHPMLDFTEKDIWEYIRKNKLPYNPLYDKGYRSIGAKPFTKPVKKIDASERAGREKDKEKIMERLRALGYF